MADFAEMNDSGNGNGNVETPIIPSGFNLITPSNFNPINPGVIIQQHPNLTPESKRMLSREITLQSTDITDNTNPLAIQEMFLVTPVNFTPIKLNTPSGNRWIFPFGNSNYGIKFHFPYNSVKNKIFLTFCEKDSSFKDGWRDYVESVTEEWVNAAMAEFINKPPTSTIDPMGMVSTRTVANNYVFRASFKGLGASSGNEGEMGFIKFKLNFALNPVQPENNETILENR